MQPSIIDTLFALVFAVVLVYIVWSLVMYYVEIGSEWGKKEYKGFILRGITWLLELVVIYAILHWVLGLIGL